jgi:8-oxo-dGTP pyrophosphatase MutT (NUDIX family)
MNQAAVAYIEQEDGRLLCVWNLRYRGWSLPGGKVEQGETVEAALARELEEETGLLLRSAEPIYDGPHGMKVDSTRGSHVHVFRVEADGEPQMIEEGCPVTWLTRDEFLATSPFAAFYESVFAAVPTWLESDRDAWQRRALLAESRVAPLLDQQSSILASVVTLANVVGVETVIGESIAGLVERVCTSAVTDVLRIRDRIAILDRDGGQTDSGHRRLSEDLDWWKADSQRRWERIVLTEKERDAAVKRAEEAEDELAVECALTDVLVDGVKNAPGRLPFYIQDPLDAIAATRKARELAETTLRAATGVDEPSLTRTDPLDQNCAKWGVK